MPYVVLVGMMGSGKSTVGRALAESLGVQFLDTDAMIEHKIGRRITQMFDLFGEEAFRHHETSILRELEDQDGVLATGGGIVLKDENWAEIRRLGVSVYLSVPAECLADRLERSNRKRPLLQVENWRQRLTDIVDARQERYEMADFIVTVQEEPIQEVVCRIREALGL